MVPRDLERGAQARRERGLQAARLGREQGPRGQPELLAQRELAAERFGLVAVTGQQERAGLAVADVDAADVGELGGERGPAPRALEPEPDERALLRIRFADRCEHPGGDRRRLSPERAPVQQHDAQAARPRAPGDGQPADPAADDRDVPALVLCG